MNEDKGPVARKACEVSCIGCGICVKACSFDAIVIKNKLAYIDYDKCKICRKCVDVCPQNAIIEVNFPPKKPRVKKEEVKQEEKSTSEKVVVKKQESAPKSEEQQTSSATE